MKKRMTCALLCICFLLLAGCAADEAPASPLTEEEIAYANEVFAYSDAAVKNGNTTIYPSEVSCFFTSYYEDPSHIDLWEFLLYCPIDTILEDGDAQEYRAVLAAVEIDPEKFPLPSDYVVPVRRYRKAEISALLKKYADITVEDLASTENTIYLEAYDCFYNFTSDFGPGYFQCAGGEKQGDTIQLWSEGDADGFREVLTIRAADGEYFIQSFERIKGDVVPAK